jgi:hypothetical protein
MSREYANVRLMSFWGVLESSVLGDIFPNQVALAPNSPIIRQPFDFHSTILQSFNHTCPGPLTPFHPQREKNQLSSLDVIWLTVTNRPRVRYFLCSCRLLDSSIYHLDFALNILICCFFHSHAKTVLHWFQEKLYGQHDTPRRQWHTECINKWKVTRSNLLDFLLST